MTYFGPVSISGNTIRILKNSNISILDLSSLNDVQFRNKMICIAALLYDNATI